MDELQLEHYEEENTELEKYLSDSIIRYGIEQLKGNAPSKLSCCFKDSKGRIVAGIMGSTTLNLFFISNLYTESEYRNRGLGTRLLAEIENIARQAGCNILRLNTFNKKAHRFYINAGFTETASIENYMNGFDLVYYHKKIS